MARLRKKSCAILGDHKFILLLAKHNPAPIDIVHSHSKVEKKKEITSLLSMPIRASLEQDVAHQLHSVVTFSGLFSIFYSIHICHI